MPKLTIEQAHSLPLDEVRKRLQGLADKLAEKYGINAEWVSNTEAKVKRTGVSGSISCSAQKVSVLLDLNFMLAPMKEKIESRVRRELETCLA